MLWLLFFIERIQKIPHSLWDMGKLSRLRAHRLGMRLLWARQDVQWRDIPDKINLISLTSVYRSTPLKLTIKVPTFPQAYIPY